MADKIYYVRCDDDCLIPALTAEQVLAAIAEATGNVPQSVDGAFITKIVNSRTGEPLTIWRGTRAQYNGLSTIDSSTVYLISDEVNSLDSHGHGNIDAGGSIGSEAGHLVETGKDGAIEAGRKLVVGTENPRNRGDLNVGDIYIWLGGTFEEVDGSGTAAPNYIPTGGTDGQILTKNGSTNYAMIWADPPEGGSGAVESVNGLTGAVVLTAEDIPGELDFGGGREQNIQGCLDLISERAAVRDEVVENEGGEAADLILCGTTQLAGETHVVKVAIDDEAETETLVFSSDSGGVVAKGITELYVHSVGDNGYIVIHSFGGDDAEECVYIESLNGNPVIRGVGAPTGDYDAANKLYVDTAIADAVGDIETLLGGI